MSDEMKEILRTLKAKSTRYKYCLKENISYNDESYEAYLLLDYITNLQTIEREYSSLLSENAELQQENDRLNNIINELEKLLEFEKNDYGRNLDIKTHNIDSEFIRGNSWEADYILDRLKKLKENNNAKD